MKDVSEPIIDLAYSALLRDSEPLATEVLELEDQMDVLQMQARMNTLMAARSNRDAKQLALVFGSIGAAEKISNPRPWHVERDRSLARRGGSVRRGVG